MAHGNQHSKKRRVQDLQTELSHLEMLVDKSKTKRKGTTRQLRRIKRLVLIEIPKAQRNI